MPLRFLASALALAFAFSSAGAQELTRHEFESPQMGTLFRIVLYSPDATSAKRAADAAFALAGKLNASFSDYAANSELMRLVAKREAVVSAELFDILSKAQAIAAETGGAFDITSGAHTRNWRRARLTGMLPTADAIAEAKASSGWRKLKLDPATRKVTLTVSGMYLDLGGIAKGYAADAMLASLRQGGHTIASVAAGGDIAVGDPPPGKQGWTIAIAPEGGRNTKTLTLANKAVSTSGSAEQKIEIGGKTYSHIVDPRTGLGLTGSSAVTVIGKHGTDTDPIATALSVMGKDSDMACAKKRRLRTIWADDARE